MTVRRKASGRRVFLIETSCAPPDQELDSAWRVCCITEDTEAAIIALATESIIHREALSRMRIAKPKTGETYQFQEAVRMTAGGRFLPPEQTDEPQQGLFAVDPIIQPPGRERDRRYRDNQRAPQVGRAIRNTGIGVAAFTGAFTTAVLAIAILLGDGTGKELPEQASLEPVAQSVSIPDQPPYPTVFDAPPPLPPPLPIDPIWDTLFPGLTPDSRLNDVKARFDTCLEGADGGFFCEGQAPTDMPDAEAMIVRFSATAPHHLTDILIRSNSFKGVDGQRTIGAAYDRVSDRVTRLLRDHDRSDRNDVPSWQSFWDSLTPGKGAGVYETFWVGPRGATSTSVRLRLLGEDSQSGHYVLHVSASDISDSAGDGSSS